VSRAPSVRGLFGALLAVVMLLAAGLFSVTILQRNTASQRTAAEHERVRSFLLSDQMRQSSNDLTRMVRLYVMTGKGRYRRYYNQILAIRNGTAPRPAAYDSSFWDRVLADPGAAVKTGPPASLTSLMRQSGFTAGEFTALHASLQASNRLALLEERVMRIVAAQIRAHGVGPGYFDAVRPQYEQLVGDNYFQQKKVIMAAIGRFTQLVDDNAAAREAALERRTAQLLVVQTAILIFLGITLLATMVVAARLIARPLVRLTAVTRRIALGDWSQHAPAGGVAELRSLAENFDAMADAVQRDLDARRRAECAAEQADRAKSAFLAMTSHELRTPLVAVTGALEVLAGDQLAPEHRDLVDIASRSAQTLLGVIGDVLDFSKIEAGHLDLTPVPTPIGELVDDVLAQYRLSRRDRLVELTRTVDAGLAPRHQVDAVRLRQILGNLIGNAIKFTRAGEIVLCVRVLDSDATRQRIEFSVSDTGPGISEEDQTRLFTPFAQATTDVVASRTGTGLGLVICRQLVEAMGGTISLESELGAGTTVRAVLPLPAAVAGAPAVSAAPVRRPLPPREVAARGGNLVLLVEDHPVNRNVLRRQFEALGYVTDTAGDATEAVAKYAAADYGVVFTDIQLPGADGYELAGRLRELEVDLTRPRRPILALTANALRGAPDRCREAGMDDLVVKPATLATLAAALQQWLPNAYCDAVDTARPICQSALDELTAGDGALGRRIAEHYAASLGSEVAAVCDAFAAGQLELVRRCAHRIVGAGRTVGDAAVADCAVRLERAVDAEEDELIGLLVEQLRLIATGAEEPAVSTPA
jgi:signal transduction histidine kinase/DNA-binding response OmpR family regulator